jgi:hypothetical protein
MNIFVTMDCLAGQEIPADLKSFSKLAIEQAQDSENSSTGKGYRLLASVADLKARVNENRGEEIPNKASLTTIADEERNDMVYLGKGLALYQREVVYVEMRDYRGAPLDPTPEQKQQQKLRRKKQRKRMKKGYPDIGSSSDSDSDDAAGDPFELVRLPDARLRTLVNNFYNTFHGANMGAGVCGLDIAGMVDHSEGKLRGHCSILYRLPGTIGAQSGERPADNLKLRAPMTLLSLWESGGNNIRSPLGARFELARKLVRAVCLLHSTGWLHKNIRAESVIFFPEHVSALQEDRFEVKVEIDISKPILMGYLFSRPDNISKMGPGSLPGPDDLIGPGNNDLDVKIPERRGARGTQVPVWEIPIENPAGSWHRPVTAPPDVSYGRNMLKTVNAAEAMQETIVSGFPLDYYDHPAKHADPKRLYRHAYDVYSLGILLLEVGLWRRLRNYDENLPAQGGVPPSAPSKTGRGPSWKEEDHYERRRWICETYLDRLRWSCGDAYADVVLSCLMVDSSDDEVAKASQRELCARIVADLEGCQA